MSYDLYFWRYAGDAEPVAGKDPVFVEHMRALNDGEVPGGIDALPKDEIVASVSANLKAAGWTPDNVFWDRKGAVIEFYPSKHHVTFCMRGQWSGDDANFLIDIMKEFGCPLFDPQVSERFVL